MLALRQRSQVADPPRRLLLKDILRILVVDDRAVSRALVSDALDGIGIRYHRAESDPRKAYATLATRPVHLVISDLNMPGLTGLQLLGALRRNRPTRHIAFILMSDALTPDVLRQGQMLGLNHHLGKPVTPATVRAAIERVVGRL